MFCNFDGEPFCEMCLDCGEPGDNWAGCTSCGLPEAGAADCTEKCQASPDILYSSEWRITNGATIGDHWIVSEVTMYADRGCSEPHQHAMRRTTKTAPQARSELGLAVGME